ncbi:hypothetical protein JCM19235_5275 [Vibrio maritimus]|uniref:Uncharacterized protein n=1 Tax=Vibrio maritimus TaxID=990268 RepID=A0A090RN85_9VIBR|nr:hypothetical protein JCM19235_5275 [Vibrio maritimus]
MLQFRLFIVTITLGQEGGGYNGQEVAPYRSKGHKITECNR